MIIFFHTKPKDTAPPEWTWNPQVQKVIMHPNEVPVPIIAGPYYVSPTTVYYATPAVIDEEVEEDADGFRLNRLAVDGSSVLYSIDSTPGITFNGDTHGKYFAGMSWNKERIAVLHGQWLGIYDDSEGAWALREFDDTADPQEVYYGTPPFWHNDDTLIVADDLTYNMEPGTGGSIIATEIWRPDPYLPFRYAVTTQGEGGPAAIFPVIDETGTELRIGTKNWNFTEWLDAPTSDVIMTGMSNFTFDSWNMIRLGSRFQMQALMSWGDQNCTDPLTGDEIGPEGIRYYAVIEIDQTVGVTLMSNIVSIRGISDPDNTDLSYSVWDNLKRQAWVQTDHNRIVQVIFNGTSSASNRMIEIEWNGSFGSGLSITQDIEHVPMTSEVIAIDDPEGSDPRKNVGRQAYSAGYNPDNGKMYVIDTQGVRTFQVYSLE
jgi:hypothetical protein